MSVSTSSPESLSDSPATLARLRQALRVANVGLWDWDLRTNAIFYAPEWKRMIGYEDHEIPNQFSEFESRLHPDDSGRVLARVGELVAAVAPPATEAEYRLRHKDGSYRWMLAHASFELDAARRPVRMLGSHVDITARKHAELALQASERAYRRLFDSHLQGVLVSDIHGGVTQANDAFLQMVGYTRDDLAAGRIDWRKMTPPEHAAADKQAVAMVQAGGVCPPFEKEYFRKDGSRVPVLVGVAALDGSKREGIAFVLDLTRHKELEAQLRQVQKLDAIGRLAGGVAHDFNNILTIVEAHVAMLDLKAEMPDAVRESAREIHHVVGRAANLTRQLLTFGRRQKMEPGPLDLHAIVTNMARMLQRVLGEHIRMQLDLCPLEIGVLADGGMMEQVLLNLAINARDAMPEGGRLTIETTVVQCDDAIVARTPQARAGTFVCLKIADTGTGIPADVLPHIFEPFFTTKAPGKGTGLGLATVYGIVGQHGGWITVENAREGGAVFRVHLPRVPLGAVADAEPAAAPTPLRGDELILVVEDEPALRALTNRWLTLHGYRVLTAGTGPQALEVWQAHADGIRLVVTDVVMPGGMSGFDLGVQIGRVAPELPIIYTSGYSPDLAGHQSQLVEGENFLPKPFAMERLLSAVRVALDQRVT